MGRLSAKLSEKLGALAGMPGKLARGLKGLLVSRKVRLALLGLAVAALVAAGGFVWMQKRAATVEYAVKQLNEAIAKGDLEQLARLVDFVSLCGKFADAILASQGTDVPGGNDGTGGNGGNGLDARQRYQDEAQRRLLDMFSHPVSGGGGHGAPAGGEGGHGAAPGAGLPPQAVPLEDAVFDILKKPTPIIPPDMLAQLQAHPLTIQAADAELAILVTTVEHPELKLSVPLRLVMRRTGQGWRVTELGNDNQVVDEFLNRVRDLKIAALVAFDQENDRQRSLMSTYYHIDSCQSTLFPPDSTGVVRLRVTVKGRNMGERDIVSSGSTCELFSTAGEKLASLRLENTRAVKAGEEFDHGWFYTFEDRYREVDALVSAGIVNCVAAPSTVSLGRGALLYIRSLRDLPGVRLE